LSAIEQGGEGGVVTKSAVSSTDAPKAIGPYSQAIRAGHLLFASGQIPLDPATGVIIEGDVGAQTRRVMDNLRAVLAASGLSLADVVRTTIYLIDLNDFASVNEVYGSYFEPPYPARATVQVARLPRDARVEIDAVAAYPSAPPAL
jgi:2-iminobutanoate/2-iminopropanoate deaminase